MAGISKCQESLLELAAQQGYLTFDDILNASEAFSLSVTEVDFLSEAIQLRGIIVYESAPQMGQSSQSDDDVLDYSRTDYDAIFEELLDLAPQLKHLVDEIKLFPAPQWGEVNQLARQIAEGNQFARDRMIMLYMRSVLKIALSMTKQYDLDIEDAVSSGFIGLMNAVDRYDPSGFSTFHSYASLWIQQRIQRDCNPVWIDYYFSVYYKEKMFRVIQKYEQYTTGEEHDSERYNALIERISEELELSKLDVSNTLSSYFEQKYGKQSTEMIMEMECSDEEFLPSELISDDEKVFEVLFQKDLTAVVNAVLSTLPEREAKVVRMRNGIGYRAPMTLEEIGSLMNLTRERIRQIEAKAMRKLSRSSHKKNLEGYL